jgi:tetratricopeptide (TPR) repeat protein
MSKKAFVSYSRKDSDFVLRYAGNLKGDFDLWLDQWDIPHLKEGDVNWDKAINEAILDCSHFLIILSPQSVMSDQVLGELWLALNKGKTVIPVLYQGCEVPRQLLRRQYIDFATSGKGSDDFSLISQTLRRLKGQEILPLDGPPFQIPPPPSDFTGQEEEIEKALEHFDKGLAISSIQGLGGIGKTDLAKKLAQILKGKFPDGQIMIDLMGTYEPSLPPVEAMRKVVQIYVPAERMPKEEDRIRGLYQSVLSNKYLLLLLDNARNGEQVKTLLAPPNCAVIITSRQDLSLPGMRTVRLDEMKQEKSIELLKRIVEATRSIKDVSDDCWKEIARLCGHLPLALRLAGTFLANTRDLSPEDYARSLQDERSRLERIDKGSKGGGEIGVQASLHRSYSRLDSKAARVFRMLSVFPLEFDSQAEERICQDEDHEQLSELLRWNLVDYQDESKRYRLHDLVRIFASHKLMEIDGEAARNEARQRYAEHFRDVLSFATELYKKGSVLAGLNAFDLERINIESAWAWAKENLSRGNAAASICSSFLNGPYLLELRQHPRERISWLETALAASRRLNDRSMEGAHLGNLGNAYADLGDSCKAIEYYEQALAIDREIGDKRNEGAWLGNLGSAYADLGDSRKAIEYYEQALAIDREIGDKRNEGAWLGNLGVAYKNLGDARQAIEYYEQHLTIAREISDRRGEGNALGNLGNAYAALGDARKAIEYYEQTRVIFHEIGDRRGEGAILGNLGVSYRDLGDARKAIEYYEQRLVIAREIGDRRGEGNALFNSSLALYELGKHSEAIKNAEIVLEIYRQIESPNVARVEQQLANWRR